MAVTLLSIGNQQLLQHVMNWASLSVALVNRNPLISLGASRGSPGHVATLRVENHLSDLLTIKANLVKPLGIDSAELNETFGDLRAFKKKILQNLPPWRENSVWADWVIDDIWQLHAATMGISKRAVLMRRSVSAMGSFVPKVAGLPNYLDWARDHLEARREFAELAIEGSEQGANAVALFYDSSERAARQMLNGVEAVHQYLRP